MQLFYDVLFIGFDQFVPKRKIRTQKGVSAPWFNCRLRNLKNVKTKLFKKYRRTRNQSDYISYTAARKHFLSSQKIEYKNFLNKIQNRLSDNPNNFWSFIDFKRKTRGFPSVMSYKGVCSSGTRPIASLFADYFSDIYAPPNQHSTCSFG